ncbi:uncharacterized protein LOC108147772 isoform X2 [Drosophila elegans]|uniref:uncharacterized protein LOC108147772 isoform X2 n=1 Tax=Drosophila elegans TaxID=30023 RepID=UPI001BC8411A|nr:uncharacterized protein LOC108147772 isoform X2 [Drosophila elegans]
MNFEIILFLATLVAFQNAPTTNARKYELLEQEEKTNPYLKEIHKQIDKLEKFKHRHSAAFTIGIDNYSNISIRIVAEMDEIHSTIDRIDDHYKQLRDCESIKFENYTLQNLAHAQVKRKNLQAMEQLHLKLFGSEDMIAQLASGNQMFQDFTCRTPQSPQLFLYTLYVQYVLAELKAHALVEWAWKMLRMFGQGGSSEDENRSRGAYKRRTPSTLSKIKELMSRADRAIWRCDPRKHEVGVTYEEVTRLLQGYIENEVDLNTEGSCWSDCAHYKSTKSEGCFDDEFCPEQQKCSGEVYDCRFVESDMKVCQAAKNSNRRYEYIQYESGLVHGKGGSCNQRLHNAKSWNWWMFWECSYCLCLCDDQGTHSDRFFNLRQVTADVIRNRVVTGVRFVKHNRVFHLQVQQGELLPLGVINQTTLQWKPVDEYKITDKNVQEGSDYHMLSYEKRSVDLDELKSENNSVVTGLRFKSGILIKPNTTSYWISGGNDQPRDKLQLKDAQLSTKSSGPSTPYRSNNLFIEFTNSGFKQDAGQTTLPFIDIQEVISNPAVPLSGMGLYYKGQNGFGGFLAPKLITYDFTSYVQLPTWESKQTEV